MKSFRSWWPLLVLVLLPLIPLRNAVLGGQTIGAWDQIRGMVPGEAAPNPAPAWDVLQADGVLQFYVWRDLVFEAWRKGELPLWNPHELAGTPILANSQSGAFYPFHILVGKLGLATPLAINLLAWLHLAIAGLGTYALARRLGASETGGLAAGATFGLSAFLLGWVSLASVVTTVAWVPVALACLVRLFDPNERQWLRSTAIQALAVGMMVLGGHLQFTVYGFLALFALGLVLTIANLRVNQKAPALAIVSVALGLGLAAPQLLPVLEYGKFSHRQNVASEDGYAAFVAGGLHGAEAAGVGFPNALGNPRAESPLIPGVSSYWPSLINRGSNFAEAALGVGPLALGLLFFIDRRRWSEPAVLGFAILGLLALLLAFGSPLNRLLYFGVPGWSATGSPGRVGFLFTLSMAVLAGVGLTRAEREGSPIFAAGLLVAVAAYLLPSFVPQTGSEFTKRLGLQDENLAEFIQRSQEAERGGMIIALLLTLAVLAMAAPALRERWKGAAQYVGTAGAVVAIFIPIVLFAASIVPTGVPIRPTLRADRGARIAVVNDGWELMAAAPALLPPNLMALARGYELGGYDSLLHRDTVAMLNDVNGQDSAPPANGNIMHIKPSADRQKLMDAGVTEVWTRREIPSMGTPAIDPPHPSVVAYALPGPGRFSAEGGDVTKIEDRFDGQYLEVTGGTRSVLIRDRMMPGWQKLGGDKIEAEGPWRRVPLAARETRVQLTYDPPGLAAGVRAGAIALAAVVVLLLVPGRLRGSHEASNSVEAKIES